MRVEADSGRKRTMLATQTTPALSLHTSFLVFLIFKIDGRHLVFRAQLGNQEKGRPDGGKREADGQNVGGSPGAVTSAVGIDQILRGGVYAYVCRGGSRHEIGARGTENL